MEEVTKNGLGEVLPWEQEPDHVKVITKMVDTPWFKDLTQVKRFIHGRAYRSFAKPELAVTDEETKKIMEIFKEDKTPS